LTSTSVRRTSTRARTRSRSSWSGVAVLLGLLLGPAAYGLAKVGDPLLAGKATNAAAKATALVANLTGPVLRLTNQGAGPTLDLRVQGGPPLKVSSGRRWPTSTPTSSTTRTPPTSGWLPTRSTLPPSTAGRDPTSSRASAAGSAWWPWAVLLGEEVALDSRPFAIAEAACLGANGRLPTVAELEALRGLVPFGRVVRSGPRTSNPTSP
jgi:hypothetical protein